MIRPSIVARLWQRELLELVRDQRALLLTLVLPLLVYPNLLLAPGLMIAQAAKHQTLPSVALASGCRAELAQALSGVAQVQTFPGQVSEVGARAVLGHGAEVVLDCPTAGTARAFFDPERLSANKAISTVDRALQGARLELTRRALVSHGLAAELAEPLRWEKQPLPASAGLLALMVPLLFAVTLVMTGFHHAVDSVAGEKERGTFQTLLSAPVWPGELAISKYLAIVSSSLVAAAASGAALALAVGLSRRAGLPMTLPDMGAAQLLLATLAVVLLACLLAAVLLDVALMARTVKEGQALATPMSLLLLAPVMLISVPGIQLGSFAAWVPVLNVAVLLRHCVDPTSPMTSSACAITLCSAAVYVVMALLLAGRMFRTEQVVLSGEKPWREVFAFARRRIATASAKES